MLRRRLQLVLVSTIAVCSSSVIAAEPPPQRTRRPAVSNGSVQLLPAGGGRSWAVVSTDDLRVQPPPPHPGERRTASEQEIAQLAERFGLDSWSGRNAGMRFERADFVHWAKAALPLPEMQLKLQAFQEVLRAADRQAIPIPNKAELSWLSLPVFSMLYRQWLVDQGQQDVAPIAQPRELAAFISLERHPTGTIKALRVTKRLIPAVPASISPSASWSRSQVRDLARMLGLTNRWSVNPHLRFTDGDIAYWHGRALPARQLYTLFVARAAVLYAAELRRIRLPGDQGDLSYWADNVVLPHLR